VAANIPPLKTGVKKKRGSRRLLSLLVVFFIIIFAILFFQSSFSKISDIEITGNEFVAANQIGQAAGVKAGDSYFTVGTQAVEKRVKALKTIEAVTVAKHFPGRLTISIKEYPQAAYRIGAGGAPEILLADGSAYPLKDGAHPPDRPLLTGWTDDNPLKAELCKTLAAIPDALLSDVSEIKPFPNVFPDRIKIYTRSRFEVITRISLLPDKIPYLSYYTSEFKQKNGTTGVLWLLDQDRGAPYGQTPEPEPTPGQSAQPK
jgi:cell division protein FtsQ